jgi:hypothetical protein
VRKSSVGYSPCSLATRGSSPCKRIVERARFLSPAILVQDVLNDVAGTGTARHREFVRQVGAYHKRWREYFVRLVFQKARLSSSAAWRSSAFVDTRGRLIAGFR